MIIPSAVKGKTVCVHTRQGYAVMTTDHHYHCECGGLFVRIHVSRLILASRIPFRVALSQALATFRPAP